MPIISIDGNIGSGKSTLIKMLKESFKDLNNIIFLPEPIDVWLKIKDESNENILSKFYKDQEKYAFTFQIMAFTTRMHIIKQTLKNNPDAIIITERSVYTDKSVFAKMLYDEHKLDTIQYMIYQSMFYEFLDTTNDVSKFIFLMSSPNKCHDRIQIRKRPEETSVSNDYLIKCHNYHQSWISTLTNKLIISGDDEFEFDEQIYNNIKNQIFDFIHK